MGWLREDDQCMLNRNPKKPMLQAAMGFRMRILTSPLDKKESQEKIPQSLNPSIPQSLNPPSLYLSIPHSSLFTLHSSLCTLHLLYNALAPRV
jgi:hypothetical protein